MQNKRQIEQTQKQSYTNYGDHSYWDIRYKKSEGQRFDWLENYEALQQIIHQSVQNNKQSRILNIGCGNGQIQDRLYQTGYHFITNNDISAIVIDQMTQIKLKKQYHEMIYEVMDVRNMKYQNESFDMVLDKSTIDALLCSNTPLVSVAMMLKEVYRVLKMEGVYLMVSYGIPSTRMEHLTREHINFDIQIVQITRECEYNGDKLTHYIYICKKKPLEKHIQKCDYEHIFQYLRKMQQQEYN